MTSNEHPAMQALRNLLPSGTSPATIIDDAGVIRLALWLIESTAPWPFAVRSLLDGVLALHTQVTPAADVRWRRLRDNAVTMDTDPDPEVVRWAALAEAASWPIAGSRASLSEIYQAARRIHIYRAIEATGWTAADDSHAESILEQLAQGGEGDIPHRQDIPNLFAAAHPALERRFVAQLEAANVAAAKFAEDVLAFKNE